MQKLSNSNKTLKSLPFVSIVVPFRNSQKTIKSCLNSIFIQNYKNYEVILVDNCSNDNSKNIVSIFKTKYKNLKCVFEEKKGRGSARNKGVLTSRGDIILMTDSDCIVPKDWIVNMISPMINDSESIVIGSEKNASKGLLSKMIQRANQSFIKRSIFNKNYISQIDTKNLAIKSNILKNNLFDENLSALEDFDLAIRLRRHFKIRFLENVTVSHFHKTKLGDFIFMCVQRAYYSQMIYDKYKHIKDEFKNDIMIKCKKNKISKYYSSLIYHLKSSIFDLMFAIMIQFFWSIGILAYKFKIILKV